MCATGRPQDTTTRPFSTPKLSTATGAIACRVDGGLRRRVTGNEGLALRPGDYVVIRVCDTGSGMDPEIMAKAMDPMFSTKASHINTGWGLSNSAGFLRPSGGTMKIHSAPGRGTAIDLYLPAIGAAAASGDSKRTASA